MKKSFIEKLIESIFDGLILGISISVTYLFCKNAEISNKIPYVIAWYGSWILICLFELTRSVRNINKEKEEYSDEEN